MNSGNERRLWRRASLPWRTMRLPKRPGLLPRSETSSSLLFVQNRRINWSGSCSLTGRHWSMPLILLWCWATQVLCIKSLGWKVGIWRLMKNGWISMGSLFLVSMTQFPRASSLTCRLTVLMTVLLWFLVLLVKFVTSSLLRPPSRLKTQTRALLPALLRRAAKKRRATNLVCVLSFDFNF